MTHPKKPDQDRPPLAEDEDLRKRHRTYDEEHKRRDVQPTEPPPEAPKRPTDERKK